MLSIVKKQIVLTLIVNCYCESNNLKFLFEWSLRVTDLPIDVKLYTLQISLCLTTFSGKFEKMGPL